MKKNTLGFAIVSLLATGPLQATGTSAYEIPEQLLGSAGTIVPRSSQSTKLRSMPGEMVFNSICAISGKRVDGIKVDLLWAKEGRNRGPLTEIQSGHFKKKYVIRTGTNSRGGTQGKLYATCLGLGHPTSSFTAAYERWVARQRTPERIMRNVPANLRVLECLQSIEGRSGVATNKRKTQSIFYLKARTNKGREMTWGSRNVRKTNGFYFNAPKGHEIYAIEATQGAELDGIRVWSRPNPFCATN